MHHCLKVLDIVTIILEFCLSLDDTEHQKPATLRYRELAAIARTCKVLYEPSMNVLWDGISSLAFLFRLLPNDLWYEETISAVFGSVSVLHLTRSLSSEEWELVERCTPRVRRLLYGSSIGHPPRYASISATTMAEIGRRCISRGWEKDPSKAFLPNLTSMSWRLELFNDVDSTVVYLPMIPGPRLRKFWISPLDAIPTHESPKLVSDALTACIDAHPLLQEFRIFGFHQTGWEPVLACISTLITRLHSLKYFFHIRSASEEATMHLSQLSTLTNLTFVLPNAEDCSFLRGGAELFPSLTSFSITSPNLQVSKEFVDLVSSSSLVNVGFRHDDVDATSVKIGSLLQSLSNRTTVQAISIEDFACFEANSQPDPLRTLSSSDIAPLLNLSNLTQLILEMKLGIDLDDAIIAEMAKAWPRLTRLAVTPSKPLHGAPRVTLLGLVSLATHCPHLSSLQLAWHPYRGNHADVPKKIASAPPPDRWRRWSTFLVYFWEPIGNVQSTAQHLLDVFPTCFLCFNTQPVGRPTLESCQDWECLRGLVRFVGRKRNAHQ